MNPSASGHLQSRTGAPRGSFTSAQRMLLQQLSEEPTAAGVAAISGVEPLASQGSSA